VEPAQYYSASDGTRVVIDANTSIGDVMGDHGATRHAVATVAAVAAAAQKILYLTEHTGGDVEVGDVVNADKIPSATTVVSIAQEGNNTWKVTLSKDIEAGGLVVDQTIELISASEFGKSEGHLPGP